MSKYYAVLSPDFIGIYTNWSDVEKIAIGVKGTQQKSFRNYEEAKSHILSGLSEMDKLDFGLGKNPLYLNKKFVRRVQYIADKNASTKKEKDHE